MVAEQLARAAWELEKPLALASAAAGAFMLYRHGPVGVNRLFAPRAAGVGLVRLAILGGLAWIVVVLATAADAGITGFYNFLYGGLAMACLVVASFWRPIMGITHRGDVAERGNLAAAVVLSGFTLGTAFAFAGALTGDDATVVRDDNGVIVAWEGGWQVVVAFFLLAYLELRTNLRLVDRLGDLDDAAREDRDLSAGILLAGVAVASGLVAGRAAAGDFHGWWPALSDYFKRLWPLAAIAIVGSLAGRLSALAARPLVARSATAGVLVAGAAAYAAFT